MCSPPRQHFPRQIVQRRGHQHTTTEWGCFAPSPNMWDLCSICLATRHILQRTFDMAPPFRASTRSQCRPTLDICPCMNSPAGRRMDGSRRPSTKRDRWIRVVMHRWGTRQGSLSEQGSDECCNDRGQVSTRASLIGSTPKIRATRVARNKEKYVSICSEKWSLAKVGLARLRVLRRASEQGGGGPVEVKEKVICARNRCFSLHQYVPVCTDCLSFHQYVLICGKAGNAATH